MSIISKRFTHDSLILKAKFKSGGSFSFSVGRTGEKLVLRFSNDSTILKEQANVFSEWMKFRDSENNADRMKRLEALCSGVDSGADLIQLMKNDLLVMSMHPLENYSCSLGGETIGMNEADMDTEE